MFLKAIVHIFACIEAHLQCNFRQLDVRIVMDDSFRFAQTCSRFSVYFLRGNTDREKYSLKKRWIVNQLDLFQSRLRCRVNLSWQCFDNVIRQHNVTISLRLRILSEEEHIDNILSLGERRLSRLSFQLFQ